MKIPFLSKKNSNGSPKPKRRKPQEISAYEQSQQRREDYAKKLRKRL